MATNPASVTLTGDFDDICRVRPVQAIPSVESLVETGHKEGDRSPLDLFFSNAHELNKLWAALPAEEPLNPVLARLLLLGYTSATESFVRALIRRVINCDPLSQKQCLKHTLTLGAALHHLPEMMPEGLFDGMSFSSGHSINEALKDFIGMTNALQPKSPLRREFVKVCQLRHCCVHRFGKLGAKNAIELDLHEFRHLLEKPVSLNKEVISGIAELLFCLVRTLNKDVFSFVLKRSVDEGRQVGLVWTWSWKSDRTQFMRYYNVFKTQLDGTPSPPAKELYSRFKAAFGTKGA